MCPKYVAIDPRFLHVPSEDSNKTVPVSKLLQVIAKTNCSFCHTDILESKDLKKIAVKILFRLGRYQSCSRSPQDKLLCLSHRLILESKN